MATMSLLKNGLELSSIEQGHLAVVATPNAFLITANYLLAYFSSEENGAGGTLDVGATRVLAMRGAE